MRIFLVDFENVHSDGLCGIEGLTSNDIVYVFYSDNANTISFDIMQRIMVAQVHTEYMHVSRGGKNALDFQLSSFLGMLAGRNADAEYYIISKDTGFDFVLDFWNTEHGGVKPYVRRFPAIKPVLSWVAKPRNAVEEAADKAIAADVTAQDEQLESVEQAEELESVEHIEQDETAEVTTAAAEEEKKPARAVKTAKSAKTTKTAKTAKTTGASETASAKPGRRGRKPKTEEAVKVEEAAKTEELPEKAAEKPVKPAKSAKTTKTAKPEKNEKTEKTAEKPKTRRSRKPKTEEAKPVEAQTAEPVAEEAAVEAAPVGTIGAVVSEPPVEIKTVPYTEADFEAAAIIRQDCATKEEFHNRCVKRFGAENGTALYKELRKIWNS